MTELLTTHVLGRDRFKVKRSNIQLENKQQYKLNIASASRFKDFFSMGGLFPVEFEYPDHNRVVCGKVDVLSGSMLISGYILDKNNEGK